MRKDLISVIIPVHNGERYLKRCVRSVLDAADCLPDPASAEILITDDASEDGTVAIGRELMADEPRIRVLTLPEGRSKEGVSAARNRGIEEADGEYLMFADADDVIDRQLLKVLYGILKEDPSKALAGSVFYEWSGENPDYRESDGEDPGEENVYTPSEYLNREIRMGNTRCWSKLYRRDAVGTVRFQKDLTIGEDMLFLTQLVKSLSEEQKAVELRSWYGYGYFRNPLGAVGQPFTPQYMDQILCWELMEEELPSDEIRANHIMGILLTASKIALLSGEERQQYASYTKECRQKLLSALKTDERGRRARKLLSAGYRFKVRLFLVSPKLYMMLYHKWKQ
ncbi:MAG: glycosyltransferase [Lachnospiraceae bacterium]|nr:glycosyltransferase [Lachnospiraceae bacterium]